MKHRRIFTLLYVVCRFFAYQHVCDHKPSLHEQFGTYPTFACGAMGKFGSQISRKIAENDTFLFVLLCYSSCTIFMHTS